MMNEQFERQHSEGRNLVIDENPIGGAVFASRKMSHNVTGGHQRYEKLQELSLNQHKRDFSEEKDQQLFSNFRFSKRAGECLQPLSTKKYGLNINPDLKKIGNTIKTAGRTYGDFKKTFLTGGRLNSGSLGPSLASIRDNQKTEMSTKRSFKFDSTQSASKTGMGWGVLGNKSIRANSFAGDNSRIMKPTILSNHLESPKGSINIPSIESPRLGSHM